MQEKIATIIEENLPGYMVRSNSTNGVDLIITDQNGFKLEVEVKTAKELFWHIWRRKDKTIIKKNLRRGLFNFLSEQVDYDLYVFVIRFVDVFEDNTIWNGDLEIWFALGKYIKEYFETQTLNCLNYKLCIDKLPLINAKEFSEIYNEIIKINKKKEDEKNKNCKS